MRRMVGSRPLGIWVALGCLLFYLVPGMGGQAASLMSWDWALAVHLQENDPHDPDLVERTLAHVEWGVCAADMLVQVPLLVAAILGLLLRRRWGLVAGLMAAATMVYIFAVYSLQRWSLSVRSDLTPWSDYSGIILAFAVLSLLPGLLTIWGLAVNADRGAVPSHSSPG